ncbi:MAG: GNAT family N-acetyltransferase [Verrucomicrobia bacterium]|nr:GNAT family N-acetyltransferase [Verrucomicrobiota bacterium]
MSCDVVTSSPYRVSFLENIGQVDACVARINGWGEIIGNRLAMSRLKKDSDGASHDKFMEDRETHSNYASVLSFLNQQAKKLKAQLDTGAGHLSIAVFILERRTDGSIQGASAVTVKADRVYLNAMVTAPWNIKMHAHISHEHVALQSKGVGKTLMAAICHWTTTAAKKCRLCTTPSRSAFSFYHSLGMIFEKENQMFIFEMGEGMPGTLRAFLPEGFVVA